MLMKMSHVQGGRCQNCVLNPPPADKYAILLLLRSLGCMHLTEIYIIPHKCTCTCTCELERRVRVLRLQTIHFECTFCPRFIIIATL